MPSRSLLRMMMLCLACAAGASSLQGAEIAGIVTDLQTGQAVAGAVVRAIPQQSKLKEVNAQSGADGHFRLELLRGQYLLFVSAPDSNYFPQYYSASGREQGDIINIPTFDYYATYNFALEAGGTISGEVRRQGDQTPLPNIRVCAESADSRISTTTRADGTYQFRALPANDYILHVSPLDQNYIPVYFENQSDEANADWLSLHPREEITGINFKLQLGGSVRGRVIAQKTHLPLEALEIILEKQKSKEPPHVAFTDKDGYFVFRGLTDGQYLVESNSGYGQEATDGAAAKRYLTQYYNRRLEKELAEPVIIDKASPVSDVNFELVEESRISGTVWSHQLNAPLSQVELRARSIQPESPFFSAAKTNNKGEYVIDNVPPGQYIVETLLPKSLDRYVKVFYRGHLSPQTADPIDIAEGAWARPIDFNLQQGGDFKGQIKVDDPDYKLDPDLVAIVLKCSGLDVFGFGEREYKINADGTYAVSGIPADSYMVRPKINDPNILDPDSPPKTLRLAEGDSMEGIDFNLKLGGSISGTMTIQNPRYSLDKLLFVLLDREAQTQRYFDIGSLNYTLAGIPPGQYILMLISNPEKTHPTQNLKMTTVFSSLPVEVQSGKTTIGIDFRVEKMPAVFDNIMP